MVVCSRGGAVGTLLGACPELDRDLQRVEECDG